MGEFHPFIIRSVFYYVSSSYPEEQKRTKLLLGCLLNFATISTTYTAHFSSPSMSTLLLPLPLGCYFNYLIIVTPVWLLRGLFQVPGTFRGMFCSFVFNRT